MGPGKVRGGPTVKSTEDLCIVKGLQAPSGLASPAKAGVASSIASLKAVSLCLHTSIGRSSLPPNTASDIMGEAVFIRKFLCQNTSLSRSLFHLGSCNWFLLPHENPQMLEDNHLPLTHILQSSLKTKHHQSSPLRSFSSGQALVGKETRALLTKLISIARCWLEALTS